MEKSPRSELIYMGCGMENRFKLRDNRWSGGFEKAGACHMIVIKNLNVVHHTYPIQPSYSNPHLSETDSGTDSDMDAEPVISPFSFS
jgi:hypothetical protein